MEKFLIGSILVVASILLGGLIEYLLGRVLDDRLPEVLQKYHFLWFGGAILGLLIAVQVLGSVQDGESPDTLVSSDEIGDSAIVAGRDVIIQDNSKEQNDLFATVDALYEQVNQLISTPTSPSDNSIQSTRIHELEATLEYLESQPILATRASEELSFFTSGDSCENALPLTTDGQPNHHYIEQEMDKDWFVFQVHQGFTYSVHIDSYANSMIDTVVEVHATCWTSNLSPSLDNTKPVIEIAQVGLPMQAISVSTPTPIALDLTQRKSDRIVINVEARKNGAYYIVVYNDDTNYGGNYTYSIQVNGYSVINP